MRIVLVATICENNDDIKEIIDGFAEEGMSVNYVDRFVTNPTGLEKGGRSDILLDTEDAEISSHCWAHSGLYLTAKEYVKIYGIDIIPMNKRHFFEENKRESEEIPFTISMN